MSDEQEIGDKTTWRLELDQAMQDSGDPGPVIEWAPNEEAFDLAFDGGYGLGAGRPVLAWTESRVYFPVVYDGAEWLGSAPRNPVADGQSHEGGQ